jgi:hypothetical protein
VSSAQVGYAGERRRYRGNGRWCDLGVGNITYDSVVKQLEILILRWIPLDVRRLILQRIDQPHIRRWRSHELRHGRLPNLGHGEGKRLIFWCEARRPNKVAHSRSSSSCIETRASTARRAAPGADTGAGGTPRIGLAEVGEVREGPEVGGIIGRVAQIGRVLRLLL